MKTAIYTPSSCSIFLFHEKIKGLGLGLDNMILFASKISDVRLFHHVV